MDKPRIPIPDKAIEEFCKRNHIRKLSFFGSVLRETFNSNSDIDVLVEFEPGHIPGLALTHLVQVIGEAARQVSDPFKKDHPEIPWNEIIGMRHRIVHDYLNVDEDIVWQVVHADLPYLVSSIQRILPIDFE